MTFDDAGGLDRQAFEKAKTAVTTQQEGLREDSVRLLADEVIRRLEQRAAARRALAEIPDSDAIERLCAALLSGDDEAGARLVLQAQIDGMSLDTIYLGYLAVAARRLGDWWDQNRVSFVAVTMGVGRIYAIMRGLRRAFVPPLEAGQVRNCVGLAATPGETHTLGVTITADMLRRSGWQVDLRLGLSHDELVDAFDGSDYPIIGLSAGGQHSLVPLARLIVALRICRPDAWLVVGGELFEENAAAAALVDADAVVTNADEAAAVMQAHMDRLSRFGLT